MLSSHHLLEMIIVTVEQCPELGELPVFGSIDRHQLCIPADELIVGRLDLIVDVDVHWRHWPQFVLGIQLLLKLFVVLLDCVEPPINHLKRLLYELISILCSS